MKYYAVISDDEKLIFDSWDTCKAYVSGRSCKYKSFSTKEDAMRFLEGKSEEVIEYNNPTAYTDGSFDSKTNAYSFGGVLIIDGKIYKFNKKYEQDEYSSLRNVAGEIKGAGYIINYCVNHGIKELDLYYDYKGIECWYTGQWKASSTIAVQYVEFREKVKDKIKVNFHKVKSHTNNYYNEMADILAKEALGI